MSQSLLADIFRSSVTSLMVTLLLFTLARPKYEKKVMRFIILGVLFIVIASSIHFYQTDNYTSLAKFDIFLVAIICVACKPLFFENIMQWFFNFVTAINIYIAIMILSYVFSRFLPYPMYAHTFLRFLFFAVIILLFKRFMQPLYHQVVDHWNIFFLIVIGFFTNFIYYIFSSDDIAQMMLENFRPLLLLIILMVLVYVSIFYSLKSLSSEYILREEQIKDQMRLDLLKTELTSYEDFISLSRQNRHDLRHHNSILSEYLNSNDINGALNYLNLYDKSLQETTLIQYCEHPVANTVFRVYDQRSTLDGIHFAVQGKIPSNLPLSTPDLGILFSNLLENAWEACKKSETPSPFIRISADDNENTFQMEICNSSNTLPDFCDNLPVSTKRNGGTGIKSVQRIINKYNGMLRFKSSPNEFFVQIILPFKPMSITQKKE